jgi:hypothetical protein
MVRRFVFDMTNYGGLYLDVPKVGKSAVNFAEAA